VETTETASLDWTAADLALWRARLAPEADVERILVRALQRTHEDAATLRVLPLFLWRARPAMDWPRVVTESRQVGVLQELGLVTELAARASQEPELQVLADALWLIAPKTTRDFFAVRSPSERRVAELNTPEVARRWGFVLNMGEASFRSTFEKHHELE
jgi:hypothetical protein